MDRRTEVLLYLGGVLFLLFLGCLVVSAILSTFILDKQTPNAKRWGFIVGGAVVLAVSLMIVIMVFGQGASGLI